MTNELTRSSPSPSHPRHRTRAPHNLRYLDVGMPEGIVQIVELSGDRCHVGFLPIGSDQWQYWGAGSGGYEATCARFLSTTEEAQ